MSSYQIAAALLDGRPYAGAALSALQGNPERQRCFRPIVELVAGPGDGPIRILEIGSWAGVSAVSWAEAVRAAGRQVHLTCVDYWKPYFDTRRDTQPVYRSMNEAAASGRIFPLFCHNLRTAGILESTDIKRGDARDVLPELESGSFDIVYIDGGHTFGQVEADIAEARRLIRAGGVIAGDDLELPPQIDLGEEHRALLEQGIDYAYSKQHNAWYHPGVTEAVARHFNEVFVWQGFWAVAYTNSGTSAPHIDPSRHQLPSHILESRQLEEVKEIASVGRWRFFSSGGRVVAAGDAEVAAVVPFIDAGINAHAPNLVVAASFEDAVAMVAENAEDETPSS